MFRKDRNRYCSGLLLYARRQLITLRVSHLECVNIETIALSFQTRKNGPKALLLGTYRPPSLSKDVFHWPYSGIGIHSGILRNGCSFQMSRKWLFWIWNVSPGLKQYGQQWTSTYSEHHGRQQEKSFCSCHCFCCLTWTWVFILLIIKDRRKAVHVIGYAEDVVPSYAISDFWSHFRLSTGTYEALTLELGNYPEIPMGPPHGGRLPILVSKHLLIILWFLGNQESIY